MRDSAYSIRTTTATISRCWQTFFHAPCDARVAALVRIGFAVVVLADLAVFYPDRQDWFTDQGVLTAETSRLLASPYAWSLLWWLPSTPAVIDCVFAVAFASAVLLLVGLLPRMNAACLFVVLYSLEMRNAIIFDSQDIVIRLLAFCLIWIPSGRCWSVQACLANWRRTRPLPGPFPEGDGGCSVPGWGLRLIQIQIAMVFFSTALVKLSGKEWIDGTALYYVSRLDDFFGRFPVPAWLFDTPWTVALMTWAVILVELTVPILIWFRKTRRLCLVAALLFHLANEWTMHLFLFHWIMLVGWLSFLTSDDLALVGLKRQDERA